MIASLLLLALVMLCVYVGSHRISGSQMSLVVCGAVVGLAFVIFPQLASYTAHVLGVGRGTDLLVYVSIIAGLFVSAHLYFRSKHQEWQIIELTRALALQTSPGGRQGDALRPTGTDE
ncbi:MAG: DUF2304 domain-containing protein [Candidatus Eremiobacteraeota bacterium]|nr:DUF2304 domain-containing protein [Candidatus Eremiobacteraeota bacterium]MBC5802149.1 DUF2304 domain-containing protein [Candidatus Eremiobacteraeota bacterium]MBC5821724.1 DUF2304 domain-containing protein [Candidatus Eremiobacteraeota bacterium]